LYKFLNHSKRALKVGLKHGWLPGARYTNLRDVRDFIKIGFLDITWNDYDFSTHLKAVKKTQPIFTVAQDIFNIQDAKLSIAQAKHLSDYCDKVIVVPKDHKHAQELIDMIPNNFVLGYSVPTKYGKSSIPIEHFDGRPVHLLGGRPDVQLNLARYLNVGSIDCNRFTLDATFGDYYDGEIFRPHPKGGYFQCIEDSIININTAWDKYSGPTCHPSEYPVQQVLNL